MADEGRKNTSTGGRIITQNPELLALLTERTRSMAYEQEQDDNYQKIYVDSPALEEDDEEKYKYVSTNVDDFDENQFQAFMMDKEPLDELVEQTQPQVNEDYEDDVQGPDRTNIAYPVDDDEDLRREQEYQANLLQRLAKQNNDDDQYVIPRLDLSEEEDNPRDSLDPSLGAGGAGKFHEINVRDSLEADEEQQEKDQQRLRHLMEDADPRGFKVLIGDNLEKPLDNNQKQNPFRLDLNELEQSPEMNRKNNVLQQQQQQQQQQQMAQQGDDPRLRQMFQQPEASPVPSQRPHSYQPLPYYNTTLAQPIGRSPQKLANSVAQPTPSVVLPTPLQHHPSPSLHNDYFDEDIISHQAYNPVQVPQKYEQQEELILHQAYNPVQLPQQYEEQEELISHQAFNPAQISQQYGAQIQQFPQQQGFRAPQPNQQQPLHAGPNPEYQQYPQYQQQQPQYDSRAPPQQYQAPPQQYQAPPQQYQAPPQQYQPPQSVNGREFYQQDYYQQSYPQEQPRGLQQLHRQIYGQPQQYNAQENYNQYSNQNTLQEQVPNQEQYYDRQFDEQSGASSPTFSQAPKKEKPKIDFLSRNKKDYSKTVAAAKNSYSQAYTQRKKVKENLPPAPAQGNMRGPVKAKHPALLKNENSAGTFIVEDVKPGTAETLWSKRSQTLTQVRKDRSSGGKKNKRGVLQKYPSESRVDEMKTINSAPPQLTTVKGTPRQAFTEPIKSEVAVDPNQVGGKRPLTHSVFTDDGQRVSVDINLRLVSPGKGALPQPSFQPSGYQPPPQMMGQPMGMVQQYPRPLGPVSQDPGQYNGYYYQPPLPPPPGQQYQQYPQYPQQHQRNNKSMSIPSLFELNPTADPEDYDPYGQGPPPGRADRSSPMSQRSGKPPSPLGSPFRVLPPIGSAEGSRQDSDRSQPESGRKPRRTKPPGPPTPKEDVLPLKDSSSYLDQMRKAKDRKPVDFKQYTVEDYKKLKREVRLGGLGPDLDSAALRERRDKRERQQEYAKQVKSKNKKELENAPKVTRRPADEEEDPSADLLHRRRVALEYAKSVPKPKVRPPGEQKNPENTPAPQSSRAKPIQTTFRKPPTAEDNDILDIDTLRRRHEEEKQKAAMIRQQIEAGHV